MTPGEKRHARQPGWLERGRTAPKPRPPKRNRPKPPGPAKKKRPAK